MLGKTREAEQNCLKVQKVPGKSNPADLGTKNLPTAEHDRIVEQLGVATGPDPVATGRNTTENFPEGRSTEVPALGDDDEISSICNVLEFFWAQFWSNAIQVIS